MAVIAIMVLVGIIVATGIPAAHRAYVAAVDASNAQILVSTTTTRLRDVLSLADPNAKIECENRDTMVDGALQKRTYVTFTNFETGYTTQVLYHDASDGYSTAGLYIDEWVGEETEDPAPTKTHTPLVPSAAGKGAYAGLTAIIETITYDKGQFTIKNLQVEQADGTELANANVPSFEVKVIAA